MKVVVAGVFLGVVGLLLGTPARAQRGGGFSGHFSGRMGAPRGFIGARSARMTPGPAMTFRHGGPPPRFIGTPPVVMVRPNFRARRVHPIVPHGFIGAPAAQFHPIPHNAFIDQTAAGFRFRRFHHGLAFCSPFFGFGFRTRHFGFFHRQFDCFPRLFVHPFFFPFVPGVAPSVVVVPSAVVPLTAGAEVLADRVQRLEETPASGAYRESAAAAGEAAPAQGASRPLTLLQLKDGSMYGLTDYWLEDGKLHYFTNYGGENSVPFDWIDLDKTVQLNSERDVEFVLRPKPTSR